jgi:exosortase
MFWPVLKAVLELSLRDDRYTYILAVPVVSAAFLYLEKEQIFRDSRYCPALGVPLVLLGLIIFAVSGIRPALSGNLTVATGGMVLVWLGTFILCYGPTSFRGASFPALLLLLMVPIPSMLLDRVVAVLQTGSAKLAYLLFRSAGVPVLRHGMVMSLPGVDIEVAPQCSGIRSTSALLIAGVLMSRALLRTSGARLFAIVCIGPIGIFRNAVRIFCISWLGVYVDRGFFSSSLHRRGGLLFSLVGFATLILLVWLLRRWEHHLRCVGMWVSASGL